MRSRLVSICLIFVFVCGLAATADAQDTIALAWDPSPDPTVTGYVLSWGTIAGRYTNTIDVGNRMDWTVQGLDPIQRYYFTVQAYNASRVLSNTAAPVNNGGLGVENTGTLLDDRPSIFWQNMVTGSLTTWHLSGNTVIDTRPLSVGAASDLGWKIVGTGDLNGDGFSDMVWRNEPDGALAAWFLQNNLVIYSGYLSIPGVADRGWRVAGVGDMDGDGRADLAWQHTDGSLAAWFMNGTQVLRTSRLSIPSVSDTGWQIAAVGDINSDGKADLVWRYTDGSIAAWLLNGTTVLLTKLFSINRVSDPAWRLAAAGRTDAVSPPALVWQHETGGLAVWYLNSYNVVSTTYLNPAAIADTAWRIVGVR